MPSLSIDLKPTSQLQKLLCNRIKDRVKFSRNKYAEKHKQWKKNEDAVLAYIPEKEIDRIRREEREQNGIPHYTTLMMPHTYGVVMASHTYWTTVFMSRSPVLQFSGRHGEAEQSVQAVDALMDYQMQVGGMMVPLYIWLQDVGKYGVGITCEYWTDEVIRTSSIVEQPKTVMGIPIPPGMPGYKLEKRKISQEVPGYSGNKLFNVRPTDFVPDPRVPLHRYQEGEFCGRYFELGWNEILERTRDGYYEEEVVKLVHREQTSRSEQNADIASNIEGPAGDDVGSTGDAFGDSISKTGADQLFKGYEICVNLIPKDWQLGNASMPEKWMITVTSDYKYCIGASPLDNLHGKYPFNVIEAEPEGYGLAGRGLPEILDPVQRTMDWLVNSHFYNVRKTINNQYLVDPSRVVMKDILNGGAGGLIRAKPAAYGSDLRMAINQLQTSDITRGHFGDINFMNELSQRVSGVNDQILGMLAPQGGRRSATEVRTSSTFGTNRLKTQAEYFSAMGFTPMAQKLVQNSQQYYDGDRKFKITGDLSQLAGQSFMQITPEMIAGFYDFVPVDGTLPIDRFAQANLWQNMFAQMTKFPQIAQAYDLSKIFAWVAQLSGLRNINQFKIQLQDPGLLAQQAQQGNVVPVRPGDLTRNKGMGQMPGMGQVA